MCRTWEQSRKPPSYLVLNVSFFSLQTERQRISANKTARWSWTPVHGHPRPASRLAPTGEKRNCFKSHSHNSKVCFLNQRSNKCSSSWVCAALPRFLPSRSRQLHHLLHCCVLSGPKTNKLNGFVDINRMFGLVLFIGKLVLHIFNMTFELFSW